MKNRFVFFTTHMRTLSVMVLLACSVACGWACDVDHLHRCAQNNYNYADYPNRNWVERLVEQNPNMLVRDLSFVSAHDAGTWLSKSYNYKDQYYCERELFLKGVRGYDLRLDYFESEFYLRHGDTSFLERYNKVKDEIGYHFPTAEELSKEFLFVEFKYEASNDDEHVKATFYELIRCLVEKYGQDNIIAYTKGMTIKQAQGKVILRLAGDAGYLKNLKMDFKNPQYTFGDLQHLNRDYSDIKVPITAGIRGMQIVFDYDTFSDELHSKLIELGKRVRNQDLGETEAQFDRLTKEDSIYIEKYQMEYMYGNGDSWLSQYDKKKEITKNLADWLADTDGYDKFNSTQFNSYYYGGKVQIAQTVFWSVITVGLFYALVGNDYIITNGLGICADRDGILGSNHAAYNVLKSIYDRPFGIIQYDFCGTESVDGKSTYGNKLLDLCIANNFKRMSYIKDIYVGTKDQLTEWGCDHICENQYQEGSVTDIYVPYSRVCIGYTTTNKVEESVSDVVLVKTHDVNDTTPDSFKTSEGKTYYKAKVAGFINLAHQDKQGYEPILLYYSTNKEFTDSDFNILTDLKVSEKKLGTGYNHLGQYLAESSTSVSPFSGSNSFLEDCHLKYIGYACEVHEHTYIAEEIDDNYHQEVCTVCHHKKDKASHNIVYVSDSYGSHHLGCQDCFATIGEKEDCEGTFDNGFGECKKCHNVLFDVPGMDADSTALISNAGQLVVFSLAVISNPKMHAKLTADIDFGKDKAKWIPIGFNEQYPYKGIFDGQGHVIKGIERAETDSLKYDGVFGVTDGAMIRNLGVTDCHFRGENAGVFVGAIGGSFTNIENCFSNAIAQNCVDGTLSRGGDFYGNVGKHWVYITNSCVLNNDSNVGVYTSCQKICDLKNVYTIYKNPDIYTTQLTETQYASGELCAMLNKEVLQYNKKSKSNEWCMWHQNIDATEVETLDAVPSFNQDHQVVIPAKFNGKDFIGVNFSDGIYTREYLDIEDGYDFYIPVELQIMDATTYKRDISNIEWGTICLPFEVESNGEVQYFKLDEDPYSVDIKLVKVDKVEKNTPAIFHKLVIPNFINVAELNYKILANTITPPANYSNIYQESKGFNTLHGTFESKNVREDETLTKRYLLNNNFYVVNGYINVKPFRAWLESPLMKGGEVAIEDLISNAKQADGLMYDASGRRIAVPQNGQLIIKNGKKQINKK